LAGIDGIGYAGNHGLEIQCPNQPVKVFYTSENKETILKVQELLNDHLVQYEGLLFENKGPILAIHYRLAKAGIEQEILRRIESIKDAVQKPFEVAHGKKVIEIRTVPAKTKGTALKWIKENVKDGKKTCRVYLGDDKTDEDALKVLGTDDIGIFIGKPPPRADQTAAKYYLLTVDEVWDFLLRIYELFCKR
jgi:trehalose-phosphatase